MSAELRLETAQQQREGYRTNIPFVFAATAGLYYDQSGEFFHLAVFEEGDDPEDFAGALARTHERYFHALGGTEAGRILELETGGGAFAAWMAERMAGEVLGIDLSPVQLARGRKRYADGRHENLRFIEHDIMLVDSLDEAPFDAAVCLDAACYLPDKSAALRAIATRLRTGGKFLLADWCRAEEPTALQSELILEPFYRYWGIPEMETVSGYRTAFSAAGFRLLELEDLSPRVAPNWERGYRAALAALADGFTPSRLVSMAAIAIQLGPRAVRFLKDQFYAAVFAKVAAEAGLLRYGLFLAERSAED